MHGFWRQATVGRPLNASTGATYRGINVLALWIAAEDKRFGARHWATYRQWQGLGAQVRKDEHGSLVAFYKELPRDEEDSVTQLTSRPRRVLRCSTVFNVDQVDGWRAPDVPVTNQVDPIADADALAVVSRSDVLHGGDRAYFHTLGDFIQIPEKVRFTGTATSSPTEGYYATLLHELTHWTGHRSRLNRELGKTFGDQAYAIEELIAELGAAFLCADVGVTNVPRPDHAAYVASWLEVLGKDRRAIFEAAGKATSAADYLFWLQRRATESAA